MLTEARGPRSPNEQPLLAFKSPFTPRPCRLSGLRRPLLFELFHVVTSPRYQLALALWLPIPSHPRTALVISARWIAEGLRLVPVQDLHLCHKNMSSGREKLQARVRMGFAYS